MTFHTDGGSKSKTLKMLLWR